MSKWNLSVSGYDFLATRLLENALQIIDTRYGPESTTPLSYHNTRHTLDVIEASSLLADAAIASGTLESHHKELLIIAAGYHDIEHRHGSGNDEQISAELAVTNMRKTGGFSPDDERQVRDAILATTVYFDSTGRMRQSATNDFLTQLLADADLAYLGQPTQIYKHRLESYFSEITKGAAIGSKKWRDFLKIQPAFLNNHQFYTDEANHIFSHKNENKKYLTGIS